MQLLQLNWERHPANPILPPVEGSNYDSTCCMNPFAMIEDDSVRLFYAGGDNDGLRRICLATAPLDDLTAWTRHGPLFEQGARCI